MSDIRLYKTKTGDKYWKDGKFIAKAKLTDEELAEAEVHGREAEQPQDTLATSTKACLFCGTPSTLGRFVNLQTVVLCEEHYYSENIGRIAQKLRERVLANG